MSRTPPAVVPMPAHAEGRLAKECRHLAEEARVSVRNVRREANAKIERDDALTDDDVKREQGAIQKLTDSYVAKIDDMLKEKTAEVMEI